uniref:G protein-coupled receptor n=1 Tax=Pristionchus pacificus TaxID=54126 RepID=A0A2A6CVM8_PRIPA|eukprot:PDM82178.1 G protein-coupled receptor [Pristionchus pacificus]
MEFTGRIRSKTAENCKPSEQWTDEFIRFECYQGKGIKGVKAIGCVPTNKPDGVVIKPGASFNEQYFTYKCIQTGEAVSYKIQSCRDFAGKPLLVDQTKTAPDGRVWKCYKDAKGDVKMSRTKGEGWLRAEGEIVRFRAEMGGQGTVEGTAFDGKVEKVVGKGAMVWCKQDKKMSYIEAYEVTCTMNGEKIKDNQKYTCPLNDVYMCKFAKIKKIGCMFEGKFHKIGLMLSGKKIVLCNNGPGTTDFGAITGCAMPDKTIKPFFQDWVEGTSVWRCIYLVNEKKKLVKAVVDGRGCSHNGGLVLKYYVIVENDKPLKCASLAPKKGYAMRDLTSEEMADWKKTRDINAVDVFGGVGGGSSGSQIRTLVQSKNAPKPPAIKQPPVKPSAKPVAKPAAKPPGKPAVKPAAKPAAKPDIPALTVENKMDYNEALLDLINESQNTVELLGDDDIKDAIANMGDLDGFKTGADDGTTEDGATNGAKIEAVHDVHTSDLSSPLSGADARVVPSHSLSDGAKNGESSGPDTGANSDPNDDGTKDGVDIDIVPVAGANNSVNDDNSILSTLLCICQCICLASHLVNIYHALNKIYLLRSTCFSLLATGIFMHCAQTGLMTTISVDLFISIVFPLRHGLFRILPYLILLSLPTLIYGTTVIALAAATMDQSSIADMQHATGTAESNRV